MKVPQSELDIDLVKTILGEYKMHNADIVLRSDCTAEELIDVVEGNRVYIPCIYILNKIDQISIEVRNQEEFSSAMRESKKLTPFCKIWGSKTTTNFPHYVTEFTVTLKGIVKSNDMYCT